MKKQKVNDASLCRTKGWKVGDVLRAAPTERCSSDAYTKHVKITAIAETTIVVREHIANGKFGPERLWCRHLLDYAMVLVEPENVTLLPAAPQPPPRIVAPERDNYSDGYDDYRDRDDPADWWKKP